ncbi:GAF domain-containing hybrid sensor histidine kinase/response regulator [Pseudoalteromonas pernae]|uniref:GAF domain-containing hybrid sensor histidine kinase/response regulator n=1 Tax=Pseudoalteromonas pernae TaxID=3118054 RepID=UPI003242D9C3
MTTLARLHHITSDQNLDFESKLAQLLQFGLDEFALDIGIVSRVVGDVYTVEHVITPDDSVSRGTQFALGETYCSHTLVADSALAFEHAGQSYVATHPCYQNFKLESYIGAPIVVSGAVYGTVNFSSAGARAQAFTTDELDYVTLLAQWIGIEIARYFDNKELRLQHQSLNAMSEMAKIGAWEVDLTKNTLYWSQQTKALHEVEQSYVPSLTAALSFYPEDERTRIESYIQAAVEDGNPWYCESQLIAGNNQQKWVAIMGKPEFKNGQCTSISGAIQDISHVVQARNELAKQRQHAEALLKARSEFLAKISHELRTPINGINGMLLAMRGESDLELISQRIDLALSGADTLVRLVNDVLDYSKIDAGQMQLEAQDLNVSILLNDVLSMYTPLCADKGVRLEYDFAINPEVWIRADGTRIKQILINLLSNALKFTAQGSITLKAQLQSEVDGYKLSCQVQDSGIGMSEEVKNTLFKPFTQGGTNIAREYGGTGLGLSIVHELCRMMHGEVSASSELGKGSQFSFMIQVAEGKPIQKQLTSLPQVPDLNKDIRVLVVDDNQMNRLVMKALLGKLGLEADFAENGEQAIDKALSDEGKYDVIFMDCVMPVMDGFTATRKIRESGAITQPQIIALTANTSELDKKHCLDAGMDDFIGKPVGFEQLTQALSVF